MNAMLEILKYTVPALIVFATVYFMMKQYLKQQHDLAAMQMRREQYDNTLPLKLQAYERLALFCERISADNLTYRLSNSSSSAGSLSNAMIIAIQQEWEHNLSQQIYVSDKLWEIISLAKQNMQALVTEASDQVGADASAGLFVTKLMTLVGTQKLDPLQEARKGLKEETQLLF